MRPYSNDLRERIVAALDRGEHSLRQLARLFSVSLSSIIRLLRHRRDSGSVAPKPHAHWESFPCHEALNGPVRTAFLA